MQYEGKRVLFRSGVTIVVLAGLAVGTAVGQRAVAVGKGSYAEFPPPSAGKGAAEMVERKFPLVERDDRPIPTNKLWTALLEGKAAGSLWMYPWRVDPRESGLELHLPLKWNPTGNDLICEAPLRIGGVDFRPAGSRSRTGAIGRSPSACHNRPRGTWT